jgi:predicted Fe-S protein YdhL (DUF1289 family)
MEPHSGLCVGCLRSLEEIAAWSRCDDSQKKAIWATIAHRIAARTADTP